MKYVLINGIILDGNEDMVPVYGKAVFVRDGQIERIENADAPTDGYEVLDLQGRYLMPGLINLHIHLPAGGTPKKKESDPRKLVKLMTSNPLLKAVLRKMCLKNAQKQLFSGVTTVRTVGGVQNTDSLLRDAIESGKAIGPHILASNMAVSVPGGHMAGSLAYEAKSAAEAADDVRKIAQDKPDWIKLMITGGVLDAKVKGEPGELKMAPELVRAACDAAHELGFRVAAHVESPEGVRVALENGVDTIEHGAKPTEEILRLFRARNAALVTTLSPALPYALFDRSVSHATELSQFNGNVVFEGIIENAKACLASGIPVGLGTDTGCPFITHYDMWRELLYFCKYIGVENRFALYTATKRNAEIAQISEVTGTVAPGKRADLIVTDRNPLEDISALRQVHTVICAGRRFVQPKLKKNAKIERELDKFIG